MGKEGKGVGKGGERVRGVGRQAEKGEGKRKKEKEGRVSVTLLDQKYHAINTATAIFTCHSAAQ